MRPASLQRFTAATFVSAFLCGLLACLAFTGGATAKQIELTKYEFSFNGSDAVGGTKPFNSPEKVDIDQTTQTVYVGTSFGGIYKFNAAGASTAFTGLAGNTVLNRNIGNFGDVEVDNSGTATQGRIYALNEFGPFDAYLPSGLPVGAPWPLEGLGDVCGAAIAPDGGIWFAHLGEGKFVKYNSNGTSANETITPQIGTMCDIDADAQGNIYEPVAYFGGRVDKYSPTGQFLGTIDPGPAKSVAVDQSNGNVYVDREDEIVVYDSSGGLITSFGTPEGGYEGLSGSQGLAVNKTTHAVYVANNRFGHVAIDVFKPTGLITVPDVTTGAADVNPGGALLHGIVNPDSIDTTDCHFEVGTSAGDYSTATVPCAEGLVFSGA